ncbi:MAG: hypothetical protein ACMUJM_05485 [bacterium]
MKDKLGVQAHMSQESVDKLDAMGKKHTAKDKLRVQFDMSKESVDKLDTLGKKLAAPTRAYTIKMALSLLEALLKLKEEDGGRLYFEKNGERRYIVIPGFFD